MNIENTKTNENEIYWDAEFLQKLLIEAITEVIRDECVSDEQLSKLSETIGNEVEPISNSVAKILYKALRKRMNHMLRSQRRAYKGFEKRHYLRWKEGIDFLEAFMVLAYELGANFNQQYRIEASNTQDYLFEALTRLHARAVQIGFEVLLLLSKGFADGAHARWRSAHEIAIVSNFLATNGQDVAKRYLDYEVIESYEAMRQFQKYAESLGYDKFPEEDLAHLRKICESLAEKYGPSYYNEHKYNEHGWAAKALGKEGRKDRVKISDIEKAVELDHYRPYYRMASQNIHASPKGSRIRLGLRSGEELLLAGPSNYGLFDPAYGIAVSVLQSTVPLLTMKKSLDAIVMSKVLEKYVANIENAFGKVDNEMKKENEKLGNMDKE
jgi:hypothetical protein